MGAKSGRLCLYCFCSYSVFPKLVEPEPCLLCQWMCWRPKMLKQLCLLVMGAALGLLQGDVLHWQTHNFPSWSVWNPLELQGRVCLTVLSYSFALFCMGCQPWECFALLHVCKRGWEEKNKVSLSCILDFPQGVWNCLGECLNLSASKGVQLSQRRKNPRVSVSVGISFLNGTHLNSL